MSTLSDALAALKNIVLLQERLEAVQRDVARVSLDITGLDTYVRRVEAYARDIDKRLVRIETMVEMSRGRGQDRLEG